MKHEFLASTFSLNAGRIVSARIDPGSPLLGIADAINQDGIHINEESYSGKTEFFPIDRSKYQTILAQIVTYVDDLREMGQILPADAILRVFGEFSRFEHTRELVTEHGIEDLLFAGGTTPQDSPIFLQASLAARLTYFDTLSYPSEEDGENGGKVALPRLRKIKNTYPKVWGSIISSDRPFYLEEGSLSQVAWSLQEQDILRLCSGMLNMAVISDPSDRNLNFRLFGCAYTIQEQVIQALGGYSEQNTSDDLVCEAQRIVSYIRDNLLYTDEDHDNHGRVVDSLIPQPDPHWIEDGRNTSFEDVVNTQQRIFSEARELHNKLNQNNLVTDGGDTRIKCNETGFHGKRTCTLPTQEPGVLFLEVNYDRGEGGEERPNESISVIIDTYHLHTESPPTRKIKSLLLRSESLTVVIESGIEGDGESGTFTLEIDRENGIISYPDRTKAQYVPGKLGNDADTIFLGGYKDDLNKIILAMNIVFGAIGT